jgi:hypothetical protein
VANFWCFGLNCRRCNSARVPSRWPRVCLLQIIELQESICCRLGTNGVLWVLSTRIAKKYRIHAGSYLSVLCVTSLLKMNVYIVCIIGHTSDVLMEVGLAVFPQDKCEQIYNSVRKNTVRPEQMCAGGSLSPGRDTCTVCDYCWCVSYQCSSCRTLLFCSPILMLCFYHFTGRLRRAAGLPKVQIPKILSSRHRLIWTQREVRQ